MRTPLGPRSPWIAALGCSLLVAVCVAPRPARADAVEDLAKVLDVVGQIPGVPITGQEVLDSRSLFSCIDHAGDDLAVAKCLDSFKDTSVGKKAWSQTGLPSWFLKLIDVYIDVREGDFLALVGDVGYTIACAVANVVFAVDVCGIAQAILDTIGAAGEILSDIGGFIKDVGGEILSFFGVGGGSSGPPLWQVLFNTYLKPNIGGYADDWLEQPATFKTEFDVTGQQSQSLLCTIAKKQFVSWTCSWMFKPLGQLSLFDQAFQPWVRGDTIKAVQMAQAAAVTQGIATVGKRAKEWLQFKHDWATYRAPADQLRKAYGLWGSPAIRLKCVGEAQPWKQFLDNVSAPEVKPEASKALSGLSGWKFENTTQFCQAYEAGLTSQKFKDCSLVGTPSAELLRMGCVTGALKENCESLAKKAGSAKFPPALVVQCTVVAVKKGTPGPLEQAKPPIPKPPVQKPQPPVPNSP